MVQFDFNSLLKTMDKAGIMAMVEKEVDKVIAAKAAKEVEQERHKIAKANVACDNYSVDDLIILDARLNRKADTKVEEAKSIPADFIEAGKMPKYPIKTKPLIMTPEEFAEFLNASLGDIKRKKSSEKTTYDEYFKDSFF
ncbi:MAG: hypothetical protein GX219_04525 [Tissierellia bacterium]|nr:hypothetical protein [Tissierellia bacterium]